MSDPDDAIHRFLDAFDSAQRAKVRWRAAELYSEGCDKDPEAVTTQGYKSEASIRLKSVKNTYRAKRGLLADSINELVSRALLGKLVAERKDGDESGYVCAGCDKPILVGQSMVGSDVFSVYAHKHCEKLAQERAFPKRGSTGEQP